MFDFLKRERKNILWNLLIDTPQGEGMLFVIGICRYMHLLYKVEKTSGDGNRWLGLQPERFFLEALVVGG